MALKLTATRLFSLGSRSSAYLFKPSSNLLLATRVISSISIDPKTYPQARRDNTVIDDFHGTKVPDPYRWMEQSDSPETLAWIKEINKVSEPFLAQIPNRAKIQEKLTSLWDYEKYGCIEFHGDYYYFWYNSGLQNHPVLYQQKSYKEKGKVFFDPNVLSSDGTTALTMSKWTEDGKLWAYGLSEKGSDWVTLKFKTSSGEDLSDTVTGVKYSSIAWLPDNSGVFYSKYPEHKSAMEGTSTEKHENHSLYFHKLGTSDSEDFLVADFRENPDFMNNAFVTEDGRYLLVNVFNGCEPTNQVYYYDLKSVDNQISKKLGLKPFFSKADARYYVVDTDDDTALVLTDHNAPMFKLIRVKIGPNGNDPSTWETVVPEDPKRKLEYATVADNDKLIVAYMEDCCHKLYVHDLNTTKLLHIVPIDFGSITGLSWKKSRSEVFFTFANFLTPTVVYRLDFKNIKNGALNIEEIHRTQVKDFDPSKYKVQQHFVTSKDGTKVPMFIVHRADIKLNGENPTYMYAYGGFGISVSPYFTTSNLLFLNNFDGVVAVANIRGGSEYGETWHQDGMLHKKQNCFDDFIACAEHLIDEKFTSPRKLAIHGASNSGILVAACSQQRPDLYGAVITEVGVLDMLRFHKFTVGAAWIPEYGNPEKKEDFETIYKYSPLHNIRVKPGIQWPSTLLMSADHDDRCVCAHTLKYCAQLYHTLQKDAANIQTNPVICRIEVKAGHGSGKPTSKAITELSDMFGFIGEVLGAKYHE